MRKWMWLFLILAGVAFPIIVAATNRRGQAGPVVAAMILSIFLWIGVGVLQSHVVGLRRKLTRHLRDNWNNVAIVSHVIPTAERANFQLALDELRLAEPSP